MTMSQNGFKDDEENPVIWYIIGISSLFSLVCIKIAHYIFYNRSAFMVWLLRLTALVRVAWCCLIMLNCTKEAAIMVVQSIDFIAVLTTIWASVMMDS